MKQTTTVIGICTDAQCYTAFSAPGISPRNRIIDPRAIDGKEWIVLAPYDNCRRLMLPEAGLSLEIFLRLLP
jgi:hypothetical protein